MGALTAFTGGVPDKSRYRRFKIREVAGQDDYAMLREVVQRHYGKAGQDLPDLLVVDGGRGQLNVVLKTLQELALTEIPVVGLAKATEQDGRPVRDRLFLPGRKNPLLPPANAPGWLLLLRLRDETHRFAITYHRNAPARRLLASALDRPPASARCANGVSWNTSPTLKRSKPPRRRNSRLCRALIRRWRRI